MENFVVSLVCIALLIIGAVSIATSALNAVNGVSDALRAEETIIRSMIDSSIDCTTTSTLSNGSVVNVDIQNTGKTDLYNYSKWDVIVHYQGGDTLWIPYGTAIPGWVTGGFFFPGEAGNLRT